MGDCTLFRTYDVANAHDLQHQLAKSHIWTRIFPYSDRWIRLGLPPKSDWYQLEAAL
jgi:cobalamin biosynthetic protein CobC